MSQTTSATVEQAIEAFQAGSPLLVHDAEDREGETDLIYPAEAVTSEAVSRLRNDAGGLICVAFSHDVADAFDLAYMDEIIDHPASEGHDLGYDSRSSFTLTVNHRDTYTGITDDDRALTITELAHAAGTADELDFADEFRAPGHVHLLRAAPGLLDERQGHTELGVALANAAELSPAVVVCEMLDDQTGGALSPDDARAYAERHGFPYLEGAQIIETLA
ncbi:3,4-dihydroxy-2-butanone-4-phosphate synthase [Haladaptatus cibarius]|uniref:3,4-dihydroxy-2-butanone-4-phosphate synthase n=1 Tax=Haladaptatus cibarius TaxID=453847 RepID=UPI000679E17E|nr:3,4-dihydroxy-2-butanone-4-phosphate synthase [Haladaptatus cibarius]